MPEDSRHEVDGRADRGTKDVVAAMVEIAAQRGCGLQPLALQPPFDSRIVDQLGLSLLVGGRQSAGTDPIQDASELLGIEPDAVLFADIDDHMAAMAEILADHQFAANRTGQIAVWL